MILSISTHIYAKLKNDEAITALVGGNIFPLGTKNEVQGPFIVYSRDAVDVEYDKGGRSYAEILATVYAVAPTYAESITIAEGVVAALDKVTASYTGYNVEDAKVQSAVEGYVEGEFVQQVQFKFTITENA